MFLLRLVVFVVVLGCLRAGIQKAKYCNHCMPYKYCKKAIDLVEASRGDHNLIDLFRNAFCGYSDNKVMVCCPDFETDVPTLDPRWDTERPNTSLLPDSCGNIARDRIVGGVIAGLYEFPWMVAIAYGDNADFQCSGTLINSRYVLTAAHCVVGKEINYVQIGDYNLVQERDCVAEVCENYIQQIKMEIGITHEDFDWNSYTNDIALLRLKTLVNLPLKNVNTICLPTTTEAQQQIITDKDATVAGWGLNEYGNQFSILRKVDIRVQTPNECQTYYSHLIDLTSSQFCAGLPNKDSCKGDSGGPLMIEVVIQGKTKIVQYGIVSIGQHKCGAEGPAIYTDVRKYTNWILRNIEP